MVPAGQGEAARPFHREEGLVRVHSEFNGAQVICRWNVEFAFLDVVWHCVILFVTAICMIGSSIDVMRIRC